MIVIKIDAEYTPELREFVMKLFGRFNVVSFTAVDDEEKTTGPQVRSGATDKDLSSAVSAAVDKVKHV